MNDMRPVFRWVGDVALLGVFAVVMGVLVPVVAVATYLSVRLLLTYFGF